MLWVRSKVVSGGPLSLGLGELYPPCGGPSPTRDSSVLRPPITTKRPLNLKMVGLTVALDNQTLVDDGRLWPRPSGWRLSHKILVGNLQESDKRGSFLLGVSRSIWRPHHGSKDKDRIFSWALRSRMLRDLTRLESHLTSWPPVFMYISEAMFLGIGPLGYCI